jgi:hypothetical protein
MPRDAAGNYTLPMDPVIGGTPVEASWANPTLDDIAQGLTDSLDRDGNGTMNVGLQYSDGTKGAPGISWSNEPLSGFRRAAQFDQRVVVGAADVARHVRATEVAGKQHPHEVYDGLSFKPTLLGIGGVKEAPTFSPLVTWENLTVGADATWGNFFEGPAVINSVERFAWASVTGATGAIVNARNVASVSRLGAGYYLVTLTQPMLNGGKGIVLVSVEDTFAGWIECAPDGSNTNRFLVFTGTAPNVNSDADFSVTVVNNMVDPPAVAA